MANIRWGTAKKQFAAVVALYYTHMTALPALGILMELRLHCGNLMLHNGLPALSTPIHSLCDSKLNGWC